MSGVARSAYLSWPGPGTTDGVVSRGRSLGGVGGGVDWESGTTVPFSWLEVVAVEGSGSEIFLFLSQFASGVAKAATANVPSSEVGARGWSCPFSVEREEARSSSV